MNFKYTHLCESESFAKRDIHKNIVHQASLSYPKKSKAVLLE